MEVYFGLGVYLLILKLSYKNVSGIQIRNIRTPIKNGSGKWEWRKLISQSLFVYQNIETHKIVDIFYEGLIKLKKGKYSAGTHKLIITILLRRLSVETKVKVVLADCLYKWYSFEIGKFSARIKVIENGEGYVCERILTLPMDEVLKKKFKKYKILLDVN